MMTSHRGTIGLVASLLIAVIPSVAQAQPNQKELVEAYEAIKWVNGPGTGDMGNATIKIPPGYRFTDSSGVPAFCHVYGNNYSGEIGVLEPIVPANSKKEAPFFILFSFSDTGYVKDDDKADLNDAFAEQRLKELKEATEQGNAERKTRGFGPIHVTGWNQKPFFDDQTKNLTWAVTVSGAEGSSVNYVSKVLGRRGVMSVNMVVENDAIASSIPEYRKLVAGLSYKPGDNYSEFREGDKVAEYGLIGLASGGVAIAAIKWWKPLMKFGIFILAGIAVAIKKVFSMFKRKPAMQG